jgi:curli biogenesis system outer membrane secretion channel CsgG
MQRLICGAALILALVASSGRLRADETLYPTAIFAFQERGSDVKGLGPQVADLLFAGLVVEPNMYLVDRQDLEKVLNEQELSASGVINPAEAARVGQLTGAKLLVTGSVLQVRDTLYVVAKVIGTETTRVVGASVKGGVDEPLDALTEKLAKKIIEAIDERADDLVAKPVSRKNRIAALRKKLGKGPRPVVKISISERHVGRPTSDPAAETEMIYYCQKLGFEVVDAAKGDPREADILILGEGFSEFTARVGDLAPAKARLEVKAVDAETGRVLAVDRQTTVAVDLNEQIAGKTALQKASAAIAERLLPKLTRGQAKEGKKKRKRRK